MPSVPNRYYNSPWIAQAAQNLGQALYPDPNDELRSLQMQQAEASLAQGALKARLEAEDRETTQRTMAELSEAFAGVEYEEATGQPTPESMNRVAAYAAKVPGTKASDLYNPLSRFFTTGQSQFGQTSRNTADIEANKALQEQRDALAKALEDQKAQHAKELEDIKQRGATHRTGLTVGARKYAADKQAAGVAGKPPKSVPHLTSEDIAIGLETLANETGYPLTDDDRHRLQAATEQDWQKTGSPEASLQRVWMQEVVRKGGYGTKSVPNAGAVAAVLRKLNWGGTTKYLDTGLGDVASGATAVPAEEAPPAEAEAPAEAPAGAPPITALKEGIATKFANGQMWTLQQGQPVRLK